MTGITKDRIADEAFETAALLVSHSLRIAHQHQLVRLIGTLERRMYIMIIVAHEPQPLVKSKAANGDFRLRRIDFQHDASGLPAKSLQYPAAHIGTAQVGRNGQKLNIDIFRSRPVIKNAYQPAVRPDAVGRIVRIGKSLQMVFQRTDLLLGERVLIDRPRLVPTRVGRRSERSELQIGIHR